MNTRPVRLALALAASWGAALPARAADDAQLYRAAIAAADATLRLHDTKAAKRWLEEAPKPLRGFEWRYLRNRVDESVASAEAGAAVNDVAVSADGTLVASTGRDGSVKIWDGRTLAPLRSLAGHSAAAWGVAFSPDGKHLASGSSDGTARVWDVATGVEARKLTPTGRGITGVAFSPDGKWLATTSWDRSSDRGVWGLVRIWDPRDGRLVHSMEHGVKPIVTVAFSPDGSLLAAGTWDDDTTLWRTSDWTKAKKLQPIEKEPYKAVQGIAFSPDGSKLVVTAKDGVVRVWDIAAGVVLNTLVGQAEGQMQWINDAVFLDEGRLASVSQDGTVRLWDTTSGRQTATWHGHTSGVSAIALSRDGCLITGSLDQTLKAWNPTASNTVSTTESMYGLAFAADGERVATIGWKGLAKTFDARGNRETAGFVAHAQSGVRIDWSRDGGHFATTGNDHKVLLWDAATGVRKAELLGSGGGEPVAFHPGSSLVAAEGASGIAKIWRVPEGVEQASLADGEGLDISDLTWSPDGTLLAVATSDGRIRLWEWKARTIRARATQPRGALMLAFDPSGRTLAVGSSDRSITLWKVASGERERSLSGHDETIHNLAFSPDGKRLASVASDHTTRIWDPSNGELLLTIPFGETPFNLAWSPDGQRLAVVLLDRTLRWIEGR